MDALGGSEGQRLRDTPERNSRWKAWGPYLSERPWGTVREDYSTDGEAWAYFSHDQARSRAYRWGEDGLAGLSDDRQLLCFALALWNGRDPILKERLFGLTNREGNHGEDVKEYYFYLDATPTSSYLRYLYKYPQAAYPYAELIATNGARSRTDFEYELLDTGIFDDDRYFDVEVEYAKASPDDIAVRISVTNRGPESAPLHLLPTLWFRNTWTWECAHEGCEVKPWLRKMGATTIAAHHSTLERFRLDMEPMQKSAAPELLFTENDTNLARIWGTERTGGFVKDGINDFVVATRGGSVNPRAVGTKVSALYLLDLPPGESTTIRLRLWPQEQAHDAPFTNAFETVVNQRRAGCDEFYA